MREKKQINIQIGEQIRQARESVKLTQEQFAEKIEVSPQYISDLERGIVGISIPTLKRACVALGVLSDQILFGTPTKDRLMSLERRCCNLTPDEFDILLDIVENFSDAIKLAKEGIPND